MRRGVVPLLVLTALAGCAAHETAPTATSTIPVSTTSATVLPTAPSSSAATDVEQAIIDAYTAAHDAYFAAAEHPDDPQSRRDLGSVSVDDYYVAAMSLLDSFVLNGQQVSPSASVPATFTVGRVEVRDGEATATACLVNSWIFQEVDASGTVTVLDDSVSSYLYEGHLVLVDGEWRLAQELVLHKFENATSCS